MVGVYPGRLGNLILSAGVVFRPRFTWCVCAGFTSAAAGRVCIAFIHILTGEHAIIVNSLVITGVT